MAHQVHTDLAEWRERTLNALLLGVCVVGTPAAAMGLVSAWQAGASIGDTSWSLQMMGFTVAGYGTLVWLAWKRPFGYQTRAALFIGLIYAIGAYALAQAGLASSGRIFLLSTVMLATVLFGWWGGVGVFALGLVTLLGAGVFFVGGVLEIPPSVARNSESAAVWTSTVLSFGVLGAAALASTNYLLRRLQDDVERRARSEAIVERYRDRLEDLVQERTTELEASRDRLAASERLASVGTLAAGVAHEINNPVGSILAAAQYAQSCVGEPEEQEVARGAFDEIVAQAERCGRIVRSVLQFSHDQPTEKWEVDVNDVARRACDLTERYAAECEVPISFTPCKGWSRTRLNPIEMEQVFVNLLRNAVQASPPGASVQVEAASGSDWIRVQVADEGPGIPADRLPRIFDPFFTTRLLEGGTGLGLSVAHGIVVEHGGTISAETNPQAGTVMMVNLPLCKREEG